MMNRGSVCIHLRCAYTCFAVILLDLESSKPSFEVSPGGFSTLRVQCERVISHTRIHPVCILEARFLGGCDSRVLVRLLTQQCAC